MRELPGLTARAELSGIVEVAMAVVGVAATVAVVSLDSSLTQPPLLADLGHIVVRAGV